MVLPCDKGGINLKDMHKWNKAALSKHLWNLAQNKENMCVKWVHSYYLKNKDVFIVPISMHAFWSFKKIIKQRSFVTQLGVWDHLLNRGKFSIGRAYKNSIE